MKLRNELLEQLRSHRDRWNEASLQFKKDKVPSVLIARQRSGTCSLGLFKLLLWLQRVARTWQVGASREASNQTHHFRGPLFGDTPNLNMTLVVWNPNGTKTFCGNPGDRFSLVLGPRSNISVRLWIAIEEAISWVLPVQTNRACFPWTLILTNPDTNLNYLKEQRSLWSVEGRQPERSFPKRGPLRKPRGGGHVPIQLRDLGSFVAKKGSLTKRKTLTKWKLKPLP